MPKFYYGGQAVIEGVMMRAPHSYCVAVRKGNGESYTPQLPHPLHAGTEFVVREERGSWLAIQLDNGTSGWIQRDSAALL